MEDYKGKTLESMTVEQFANKYGKLQIFKAGENSQSKTGLFLRAEGTDEHPNKTTVFISSNAIAKPERTKEIAHVQYPDDIDEATGAPKENWVLQNVCESLGELNSMEDLVNALK